MFFKHLLADLSNVILEVFLDFLTLLDLAIFDLLVFDVEVLELVLVLITNHLKLLAD